jgi:pyridoxamine 5'-phosphate oxidase
MEAMVIHHLRRAYEQRTLSRQELADDPLQQFAVWFREAAEVEHPDWLEINAMTLATYDPMAGCVAARIVLLKHFDHAGFTFFTNYESDKGRQLAACPRASLVLYWPHVERQVRIEGSVTRTDRDTSQRYFSERPRSSQLGAIASQQSRPLLDDAALAQRVAALEQEFGDREIPCPENWGGYRLHPTRLEFWQGRPDRLHDRFVYVRSADTRTVSWSVERLSP